MKCVVNLEGISRTFQDGARSRDILRGIDLTIHDSEIVALVGASGCGKTTLLNIIGALDPQFSGTVTVIDKKLDQLDDDARATLRNEHLGFVFQAFHLLEHLTVAENVCVPLWVRKEKSDENRATSALEKVGMADRLQESVRFLSGGERQRVAIARAIVNQPKLLLADEPTGNLDQDTGKSIYRLFDQLRQNEGCAVVVATHDRVLAQDADRIFQLADGHLEECPEGQDVREERT